METAPRCYLPRRYIVGALTLVLLALAYNVRVGISSAIIPMAEQYKWPESVQGIVLAAFYFGYVTTQLPGGFLSARFGFKAVMTTGAMIASVLSLTIPFLTFNVYLVVAVRILQGIAQGVVFPSNTNMVSRWFPKSQRSLACELKTTGLSTFLTYSSAAATMSGSSVGTVIAMGITPLIIQYLDWQSVFYIAGGLLILWILPWYVVFVGDSPANGGITFLTTHPSEVRLIDNPEDRLADLRAEGRKNRVPWKRLILNRHVLILAWNAFAGGWGWYVFLNWMPTYFQKELHFSMSSTGIIAFLPYVLRPIVNIASGALADMLSNKKILSMSTVRKVFNTFACVIPSALLVVLALVKVTPMVAATIVILSISLAGLDGGLSGIVVDLGGEYASIITGFINVFGGAPGVVGVYITGFLLEVTNQNWTFIFLLSAGIWSSAVIFVNVRPLYTLPIQHDPPVDFCKV